MEVIVGNSRGDNKLIVGIGEVIVGNSRGGNNRGDGR